jgi:hypothetical protein
LQFLPDFSLLCRAKGLIFFRPNGLRRTHNPLVEGSASVTIGDKFCVWTAMKGVGTTAWGVSKGVSSKPHDRKDSAIALHSPKPVSLFTAASNGNVQAAREIREGIEGKANERPSIIEAPEIRIRIVEEKRRRANKPVGNANTTRIVDNTSPRADEPENNPGKTEDKE